MIAIDKKIAEENLATKMLLQVHDELIFEAPEVEIEKVILMIKTEMENAVKTKVPMLVEIGTGNNWLEAH
jgi:DNA polymerase-1